MAKELGDGAFREKRFSESVKHYTDAIAETPHNHILFSNRSAAYLALKEWEKALEDANRSTSIDPTWFKGHYRAAQSLLELGRASEAVSAVHRAMSVDPENKSAAALLSKALSVIWMSLQSLFESKSFAEIAETAKLLTADDLCEFETVNWESPIHLAARANDVPLLRALLDRGLPVCSFDSRFATPAYHAASVGSLDTLRELVLRGSDLRARSSFSGMNPAEALRHYKRGACSEVAVATAVQERSLEFPLACFLYRVAEAWRNSLFALTHDREIVKRNFDGWVTPVEIASQFAVRGKPWLIAAVAQHDREYHELLALPETEWVGSADRCLGCGAADGLEKCGTCRLVSWCSACREKSSVRGTLPWMNREIHVNNCRIGKFKKHMK